MALDNVLDLAGIKYGGATSGLAGDGDIVKDISFATTGLTGTVSKIWIDPMNPIAFSRALVRINQALGDNNIHEMEVNTRALTIISHADGGGLVSGGSAATAPTTQPPTENDYMANPIRVV